MNPAKSSRLAKERNPHLYCPKCLWRLSSGACPKHDPYAHTDKRAAYYGDYDKPSDLVPLLEASIEQAKAKKES